jgi:hypothetical protein
MCCRNQCIQCSIFAEFTQLTAGAFCAARKHIFGVGNSFDADIYDDFPCRTDDQQSLGELLIED